MPNYNNITNLQQVDTTCPATGYQSVAVCVPVTVTPFARIETTTTHCCGDPVVTPNATVCPGTINGSCRFTITQNLCVEIPVEFGATATVGSPSVQCGNATAEDICSACNPTGLETTATCATCMNS